MTRKVIIPTIALVAILAAVTMGTMQVNAQSPVYSNLVTRIAQRFNLNESDVEQVVDQVRADHRATLKTKWEDRLTQLVADGKITDAQKQAIVAKHDELQKEFLGLKNLSLSDRKTKMQQIREDLKTWAANNNLDLKQIGVLGMRFGSGRGYRLGYWAGKNS